jgi:hypothetical protein
MVEFKTSSESNGLFGLTYLNLFTGIKTRETVLEILLETSNHIRTYL